MGYLNRYSQATLVRELCLVLVAMMWWVPFYVLVTVMLKPGSEATKAPFSPPAELELSNFSKAWQGSGGVGLGAAALNSAIITAGSVLALIAVGSISAYVIARQGPRLGTALYLGFVLGILLPAQLGIVPIYVALRQVGLLGTNAGAILLYTGLLLPLSVFLYTGFIRALPRDYEEAAFIDGASRWQAFTRILFPLLSTVTGTVAVLTALIVWNDFFTQLVFFGGGTNNRTLPVAIYSFVGEYESQWNVVFAAVALALVPVLVLYFVAQRNLVRGFTGGIK
ncbi:MAG: carbohydrate ABC transporter permease [Chloroflexi bacterium]|nr:carbohydrate ABC transporter permease [Chloroflexota bacterium]